LGLLPFTNSPFRDIIRVDLPVPCSIGLAAKYPSLSTTDLFTHLASSLCDFPTIFYENLFNRIINLVFVNIHNEEHSADMCRLFGLLHFMLQYTASKESLIDIYAQLQRIFLEKITLRLSLVEDPPSVVLAMSKSELVISYYILSYINNVTSS
jgi:hypothetical protein